MATVSEKPVIRSTHRYQQDGKELDIIVEGLDDEKYDGKFSYLREKAGEVNTEVSALRNKSRNILKIAKEENVAIKVEAMLVKMGVERYSGRMKGILEKVHAIANAKCISFALNAIPIALAIIEDEGIGEKTVVQVGDTIASYIGGAFGEAVGEAAVPMLIEFAAVLGLGITEAVGTVVLGVLGGVVGAVIGGTIGTLVTRGVMSLVSYFFGGASAKFSLPPGYKFQTLGGRCLPYKCELSPELNIITRKLNIVSRKHALTLKCELMKKLPTKEELERDRDTGKQHPTRDAEKNTPPGHAAGKQCPKRDAGKQYPTRDAGKQYPTRYDGKIYPTRNV